jgi:hypothetical protein
MTALLLAVPVLTVPALMVPVLAVFAVGDKTRITRKQDVSRKGYLPHWTEELFTVSAIQYAGPLTYKINDMNDEEIKGTFYEQEIKKSTQDTFRVEKVLKPTGNKLLMK